MATTQVHGARKGSKVEGKRKTQRAHARWRARERYGLEVGRATREAITAAIREGRSTLVSRSSRRASVYDVALDGDGPVVRVVYDRSRDEIATFLPRGFANASEFPPAG